MYSHKKILFVIIGLAMVIVSLAIWLSVAGSDSDGSTIIAKEYRLRYPSPQTTTSMQQITSMQRIVSNTLRRSTVAILVSEITGKRGNTYQTCGYIDLGHIVLFASKREHEQVAKAFKKEYGDLLRPEKLYDINSVANVDVFADNFRKIVEDVFTRQKFAFLTKDDISTIADDFRDFVKTYTRSDVPKQLQMEILEALDKYLYMHFNATAPSKREAVYLGFDGQIKSLKMKLWQVIATEPLTEDEKLTFAEQKKWIYDHVETFPVQSEMERVTRMNRADVMFNDVLNGFSLQPMWEETFEELQQKILKANKVSSIASAVSCWSTEIAQDRLKRNSNRKEKRKWEFPFGEIGGYSGGSDRVTFNFKSDKPRLTNQMWIADFAKPKSDDVYDLVSRGHLKVPDELTTTEGLEQWLSEQNKGDFYYDQKSLSLVSCRGARMGVLDVFSWIKSDKISTKKLREIIDANPITSFVVSGHRALNDSGPSSRSKFAPWTPVAPLLAIESKDGEVAVISLKDLENGFPNSLNVIVRHRFDGWDDQWFGSFLTGKLKKNTDQ